MTKKILTIIGARPQFVKAGVVSKAIQETDGLNEVILHTGQHYDPNMSDVFFDQMGIPKPDYQLNINDCSHGEMTGRMLIEIEKILLQEKPDWVLVYGDTNSTLAGSLAAAKLHIPVAHVEAGLRSFNMKMPEEINRICTDQISDILFCPTDTAIENLQAEGFDRKATRIENVGDVMHDAALLFKQFAAGPDGVSSEQPFVLVTCHRPENTDNIDRLTSVVETLNEVHATIAPVVFPLHPRTKAAIERAGLKLNVNVIDPVGYFEMLWLLDHCGLVMTDSGGLQKEAFFFSKQCITMRDQTEWVELVECGANVITAADKDKIIAEVKARFGKTVDADHNLYGGGEASKRIAKILAEG